MHLETFLYMLLQSHKTVPPPGPRPDFEEMAKLAEENAVPNRWIDVPAKTIELGMNDVENDQGPERYFGWDNEKPVRQVHVPAFQSKARPITNKEYALYLQETGRDRTPVSWWIESLQRSHSDGKHQNGINGQSRYLNGAGPSLKPTFLEDKYIRTVFGLVPLKFALDWPVFASYDEVSPCAAWMGGRIPTLEEVRSIYNYVERTSSSDIDSILTKKISAVNG